MDNIPLVDSDGTKFPYLEIRPNKTIKVNNINLYVTILNPQNTHAIILALMLEKHSCPKLKIKALPSVSSIEEHYSIFYNPYNLSVHNSENVIGSGLVGRKCYGFCYVFLFDKDGNIKASIDIDDFVKSFNLFCAKSDSEKIGRKSTKLNNSQTSPKKKCQLY